jgi:hypothetical protein
LISKKIDNKEMQMNEEEIWKCAGIAVLVMREKDRANGVVRSDAVYDGWYNGFAQGLRSSEAMTVEEHAFGFSPKAHIRIIAGIGGSAEIKDISAYAMAVSADCRGVSDKEGLIVMLATALATLHCYCEQVGRGFKKKDQFVKAVTDSAAEHVKTLRQKLEPSVTIVERDDPK